MSRPPSIIIDHKPYRKLSAQFYTYQKQLGYTAETCIARRLQVEEFLSWLEQKGKRQIEAIKKEDIEVYYAYLQSRPNKQGNGTLSNKTTFGYIKSVVKLFGMLQKQGVINIDPTSTLKLTYPKTTTEKTVLNQAEITQLYEATQTAQERAILSLAYGCGIRVGEMVKCNIEDVRLREKLLVVNKGKGNKRRLVPMTASVVKDLSEYYHQERAVLALEGNHNNNERAFILNMRGRRMQKGTYNKHLKIIITRTEIESIKSKNITIHNLRHSIATHLVEQGMPIEQVRQFLGHSQLETTQVYTHIRQSLINRLIE